MSRRALVPYAYTSNQRLVGVESRPHRRERLQHGLDLDAGWPTVVRSAAFEAVRCLSQARGVGDAHLDSQTG